MTKENETPDKFVQPRAEIATQQRTRPKKIYSLSDLAESGILTDKNDPLNARRFLDDEGKKTNAQTQAK
jgi:hypothetical protein